jgi:hypothetical protein
MGGLQYAALFVHVGLICGITFLFVYSQAVWKKYLEQRNRSAPIR